MYRSKEEIHSEMEFNYLLTEVVQTNKYHKFHAVGVMSEVGLTTDRDLSELSVLRKHNDFNSSEIPEVTWYKPLYNKYIERFLFHMLKLVVNFVHPYNITHSKQVFFFKKS